VRVDNASPETNPEEVNDALQEVDDVSQATTLDTLEDN
jgi:hypothetical protein